MTATFTQAQVQAARLAADLEARIRRKYGHVSPAVVALATALLLRKLDMESADKGRHLQDLAIAAMGGVQSIDWNALGALPEAKEDSLDEGGALLLSGSAVGTEGDAL